MKTLTISIQNPSDFVDSFIGAYKSISKRKIKGIHHEISFDSKKKFDKFVKNIGLLSVIHSLKPRSVYELAKAIDMDVSNLNKMILFFEEAGVVTLKRTKVSGRTVTQPIVVYDKIEFNLAA